MTEDWRKYAIGRPADWDTAQTRWARFDTLHRTKGPRYIDGSPVRFYAVRSTADPQWNRAIRCTTHRARPDRSCTVETFTNRRFRATPQHCAIVRPQDGPGIAIAHGPTIDQARERAISLARRDNLL